MNRALPGQTLLDVVLQNAGTLEAVGDFLWENPLLDLSANIQESTAYQYSGTTVDRDVLNTFIRTNHKPVAIQSEVEFGEGGDYISTDGIYYKSTDGIYYLMA